MRASSSCLYQPPSIKLESNVRKIDYIINAHAPTFILSTAIFVSVQMLTAACADAGEWKPTYGIGAVTGCDSNLPIGRVALQEPAADRIRVVCADPYCRCVGPGPCVLPVVNGDSPIRSITRNPSTSAMIL